LKVRHLVAGLALVLAACVTKPVIETITGKPIPEAEVKAARKQAGDLDAQDLSVPITTGRPASTT